MHALLTWLLSFFPKAVDPKPALSTKIRPALAPDLEIIGDLSAETWPRYRDNWADIVIETIGRCDFNVERYGFGGEDKIIRFLVGDFNRSRKLAVHRDDPSGLVYILEDDNEGWTRKRLTDFKPLQVARVITLGELIKDGYLSVQQCLELDKYRNNRLWDGLVARGEIRIENSTAEA